MLMYTHDHVATNRARLSASAPNEDDDQEYLYERVSQYNADSIKIVRLHKTAEPLVSQGRSVFHEVHKIHETCHSVMFYFMKKLIF